MREGGEGRRGFDGMVIQTNEVVKELSPNVTPYRKGSEPKRPRRSSYWDKDIVGIGEQNGQEG
jgi:hypothetical protein